MGNRQLNRLTATAVKNTSASGYYCDGGGLYLQVSSTGSKTWIFRFRSSLTGRSRDMGLGSSLSVSLSDARSKAGVQRAILARGGDPIEVREAERRERQIDAARAVTFENYAAQYIESHKAGWKNEKHAEQWASTISKYCHPVIGYLPVQEINTGHVLKILRPVWEVIPETASRLRGRIECILDSAKAENHRSGENPALWKGNLQKVLPTLSKKKRVKHHEAMVFEQIPQFLSRVRGHLSVAARCLEFTILTAVRTSEAINARPEEFDLDRAIWTIPKERMKAGKEQRVPLSARALQIARDMIGLGHDHVFAGMKPKKPISNMAMLQLLKRMDVKVTVHGFRSSFRDWAAERTNFSHEVCEMALAHTIGNAAEAAYRRGDLFEKRQKLMEAWASFAGTPTRYGFVIPIKQAA